MNNKLKINKLIKKGKIVGNMSDKPVRIIAGFLALAFAFSTLTACNEIKYNFDAYDDWDYNYIDQSNNNNDDNDNDYNYGDYNDYNNNEYNEGYDEGNYEQENYIIPDELNKILNLNVELNSSSLNSFQNFISQINVNYKYSDYYNISKSMNAYNSINNSNSVISSNIIKNKQVSFTDLYNVVKSNNNKYFSENKHEKFYKKLNDSVLTDAVQYVVDAINYNIKNNKKIDIDILDLKLSNLKIFEYNDFGYAFYSQDDGALALNLTIIPNQSNNKITAFQEIVMHEANHILQDCIEKKASNVEHNSGFCYEFNNVNLNSLYWTWFVEAAAQNSVLMQNGMISSESIIYNSNTLALNSLNLTSALVKEENLDLGSLSVQSDLNELFNYFGCKTSEEKNEILKLMVAYNIIISPADSIFSSDFYDKFPDLDSYIYEKELKSSIGQTQTKIFYRNLAEKVKNKKVKLEDVFSLISIFETDLSRNIWYASIENCAYLGDFYKSYNQIQNEFFEIIANSLGISVDDVSLYYVSYHNLSDQSNLNNSLLTNEQNNYYKKIYNEIKRNKYESVVEIYNEIKQTGTIKY